MYARFERQALPSRKVAAVYGSDREEGTENLFLLCKDNDRYTLADNVLCGISLTPRNLMVSMLCERRQ